MYPEDENILGQIMQRDGTIPAFYALYYDPMRLNGPAVRGDWLDAVGLTQKDIVTVDQYADMLRLFKTEIGCPSPYLLLSGFDAHAIFACYDTHAYARAKCIRDGKVSFAFTSEQDKKYMTTINQWWNEDLILKDYLSISANPQGLSWITTGQVGALGMIPSEKLDFEKGSDDPNMNWVPLANPVVYEGQTIHLALGINKLADGSWWLSTKCDNIPLLMTYCDYFYSEDGMILGNYGVEGYTYNYDENGEMKFADWLVNHDAGFSNALHIFCQSELVEGGYKFRSRSYAFDGGEKLKSFIDFWEDEEFYRYDASMVYPPAIVLTDEQSADYVVFSTDVQTYMNETLPLFVDGSKPLAEWDSYVAQMREIGLNECEQIYQEAYDAYMAAN
jgi:putative aldouronate transport system substrate-binding protein